MNRNSGLSHRGSLVARAEQRARILVDSQSEWRDDITLRVFRSCREDGVWMRDYEEYAQQERLNGRNNPTHSINCELGKAICRAVNGETTGRRRSISGEIVGSYTVLRPKRG